MHDCEKSQRWAMFAIMGKADALGVSLLVESNMSHSALQLAGAVTSSRKKLAESAVLCANLMRLREVL